MAKTQKEIQFERDYKKWCKNYQIYVANVAKANSEGTKPPPPPPPPPELP